MWCVCMCVSIMTLVRGHFLQSGKFEDVQRQQRQVEMQKVFYKEQIYVKAWVG